MEMVKLPLFSKPSTTESQRSAMLEHAMIKAREMMGYFRKGEANDPVRYALATAEVLSRFPRSVIDAVTSPHGIASQSDWMPSLKEVREACESAMPRQERDIDRHQLSPRVIEPPQPEQPTVFTAEGYPRYDQLVQRFRNNEGPAFLEEHQCQDGHVRYGIMTPLHWITG